MTSIVSNQSQPDASHWLAAALATRWGGNAPPAPGDDAFWLQVANLAQEHQVAALLYRQVRLRAVSVPRDVALWLAAYHAQETWRLTALRSVAVDVMQKLALAGAPFLVLKGWGLLPLIYENDLAQRPAGDLDLFVPEDWRDRALSILQRMGFVSCASYPWPGFELRYEGSMKLQRVEESGEPSIVDLHWQYLPTPWYWHRLGREWIDRSCMLENDGIAVPVPAVTDLFLYLCAHAGINHPEERSLLRYHDLALLMRQKQEDLEWDTLLEQAGQVGVVLPLRAVLARLDAIWPTIVPGHVVQRLAGLAVSRRERWLYSWQVEHTHDAWSELVLQVATLPGLRCKVCCLMETAFPSPAYLRQRYGLGHDSPWYSGYLHRAAVAARQVRGHLRGQRSKGRDVA